MVRLLLRLPPRTVHALGQVLRALRALRDALAGLLLALLHLPERGPDWWHRLGAQLLRWWRGWHPAPGDVLLLPGAGWLDRQAARRLRAARLRRGVTVALLVHDVIPLRRPMWCDPGHVANFRRWFDGVLPQVDRVLAISNATAGEVAAYAAKAAIALRAPIRTVPLGAGFALPPRTAPASARLPRAGSYVLFVSTLEPRKNHGFLVDVWQALLAQGVAVPSLVFGGQVGARMETLLDRLAETGWLGGRIVLLSDVSDTELAALYRGCLFTVFPSLYEGWGLPVTESLSFGKPCVAAGVSSLPEAGGALVRYFDPGDLQDGIAVIRAAFEDRAGLAAWEAEIRRSFRPRSWAEMAMDLCEAVAA